MYCCVKQDINTAEQVQFISNLLTLPRHTFTVADAEILERWKTDKRRRVTFVLAQKFQKLGVDSVDNYAKDGGSGEVLAFV